MANEKRLIDANELPLGKFVEPRTEWHQGWNDALDAAMLQAPTVDAVEVVRCKDCKYCRVASWGERFCARKQTDGVYAELSNLREDDFCSYGEKMDKAEAQQDCTYNKNGHCIGQKLMPECDPKSCDRKKP